ncbi:MAG TPA: aminopeptidase [Candidatus Bathyarchaeia archaeon]|jgi:aminopeptidase|nr:aminopeptidase [Candidatus Bathyarchaeia archaeon]
MQDSPLAKKVINECLRVKEDEQVLIQTYDHTLGISDQLALETYKAGAVPFVNLTTQDGLLDLVTKVPEEFYGKTPRALLSMLDQVDAQVVIFGPRDPKILKIAPGERFAKAFDSTKPVMEKLVARKVRTALLPVGGITPERAQNYGFDLSSWRANHDNAVDVDMAKMSVLGKNLASKLKKASKVRVTHSNGTDLAFAINDRPIYVRDGIIDRDDMAQGNFGESLPSGTVVVAPIESSAEGIVRFEQPNALMGKMVKGFTMNFRNGKMTSFDAKENLDAFSGMYSGASGDKDRLSVFSIGINPNARPIGLFGADELVLGGITVGIGANKDIGGKNDTTFGYGQTIYKATVEVDGTPLVKEGKVQV